MKRVGGVEERENERDGRMEWKVRGEHAVSVDVSADLSAQESAHERDVTSMERKEVE